MQPTIYSIEEHLIPQQSIDQDALYVIHRLKTAGFAAYLVGGGVRDLLLKKTPKDFDISTSAKPEEIKKLFGRQCLLIGRRFRLAHIRFGHKILEVSTFRSGESTDDLIVKDNEWGTESEDVLRRDFTINGLFYDPENQVVIDYVGGWKDLKNHVLRTIGVPEVRFKQDPVRMIRLFKFKARFGFHVDPICDESIEKCRQEIIKSSPARVLEEIFKMLESCASEAFFRLLLENGFIHLLFPTLEEVLRGSDGEKIFAYLRAVDGVNKVSVKYPIERPVLAAALIFPLLEKDITTRFLDQKKIPHLGEVLLTTSDVIRNFVISSFSHFPRRISALMGYVMSTQYRLTPLSNKRMHQIKMFKIREFPLALRLLKLRAIVEPNLQQIYIDWRENYRHFLRTHEHPPHRHTPRHQALRKG